MNIYKPTGKKIESFPMWVDRLIKENQKLLEKLRKYEDRERTMHGTGTGQEGGKGTTDKCPYCEFVDEGGKHDSVH